MNTLERHACACSHAGTFAEADASLHYPPDLQIEPIHLELTLRVDLEREQLSGHARLHLRGHEGADRLELDALDFEDVTVGGASSAYDGKKLRLGFATPFAQHEVRYVDVRWTVHRPVSGLLFSKPTPTRPDAGWFAVTDHETERARHWLPTVDHPSARPTLHFTLTADERFVILANGAFEGEQRNGDGTKTARYHLDHPCPSYLTCFAIGDFVRWEGPPVDGIPVAAFAPRPFTEAHLERSFGKTSEMLAWMQHKLGVPYPYPKYFQFAATGIGGAMENISLVSWDDRFLLDEALETEERQLIDVVNVHEMAHAWFGDHVVCRDFAHSWLKESWATYVETVWIEEHLGKDAADYDLFCNAESYFHEHDDRYKRPIVTRRYQTSWDLFDMHLYPGGAWRLHMLRRELGDAVFWEAVTAYLRRHGRSTAETDDFRRALEERSGRSLARFFDQWLLGPGFPELSVSATHDASQRLLRISVDQKQVDAAAGIPCFTFELDVLVDDAGTIRRRTLLVDKPHAELVVDSIHDPAAIVLDPDYRLLARFDFDPGDERLRRQLTNGADVRLRIEAGRRLAKSKKVASIRAVATAFAKEPFHGVRAQWASALAEAGTNEAVVALLGLLESEADPRVLPTVFRALGKLRDPRILPAIEARLARGVGPRASEAAHEAIGAQRESGFGATLRNAIHRDSFGGFAAAGALRGLGSTRHPEAESLLRDALAPLGSPSRARPAAAAGLGSLASTLEGRAKERSLEALIDALRDEDPKVRRAAASALTDLADPRGLAAVRSFAASLTPQERVRVERGAAQSSPTTQAALKQAEQRLDTLSKQLDELRARLETLEAEKKKDA